MASMHYDADAGGRGTAESTVERAESPRRIGVLSLHNSAETKAICNAVAALGHEPVWLRRTNLDVYIEDDVPHVSPTVDVVINRLLLSNAETPLEDLELLTTLAGVVPVVNEPRPVLTAIHKYATAMKLAASDVPTPDSAVEFGPTAASTATHVHGRSVEKPAIGTHGDDARRYDDDSPPLPRSGHRVHQSFVETAGAQSDVRVYVVDGTIVGAMRRTAPDGEWRANVARGGATADVTDSLGDRVRSISLRATDAVGLDVAGVDLIREGDEWYVLEVNPTAGFRGLFGATGHNPAPDIARTAIERVGGTVSDDAVDRIAASLDDSVPDCKPSPSSSAQDRVVGLTETIDLVGRGGTERVIAKVDTGADRTSIDVDLAAAIGAGPIVGTTTVRSATNGSGRTRPLVDVRLAIDGRWETATVGIDDRSHLSYPVILGRDVLDGFHIDVDRRASGDDGSEIGGEVRGE